MLHHYDETGLLCPSSRTQGGYRQYDEADEGRLRRILTYRALGFSLGEIAAIVDDPRADAGTHLRRQHHLLTDRISRLTEMLAGVERALEEHEMSEPKGPKIVPTPDEQIELLGEVAFLDEWAQGVVTASGDSPELAESARRISGYTVEDWRQIMDEEQDICRRLADTKAQGLAPESTSAMDLPKNTVSGSGGGSSTAPPSSTRPSPTTSKTTSGCGRPSRACPLGSPSTCEQRSTPTPIEWRNGRRCPLRGLTP